MIKILIVKKLWIDDYIMKQASYLNEQKQIISAVAVSKAASSASSTTAVSASSATAAFAAVTKI